MGNVRIIKKLLKFFINLNNKVDLENRRYFYVYCIASILGAVVMFTNLCILLPYHVLYAQLVYLFGGIIFIICFLYLLKFSNNSKSYILIQSIGFIVTVLQESLLVYLLGLDGGFQFFLICTISIPFFGRNFYRNVTFVIATVDFVLLEAIFKNAVPFYSTPSNLMRVFAIINILSTCTIVGTMRFYYLKSVTNSEQIILKKNAEITDALNHLANTQDQLIQSEKMAVLGQLISGVAHEINTPLGAIKASINNITVYLKNTLEEKVPQVFHILNEEERTMFFHLLYKSMENNLTISSREKRSYTKAITSILEENGIGDAANTAGTLVDMGIYDGVETYFPLLTNQNSELMLQTCYEISGIMRNSENINIAVDRAAKIIFALKNYSHNDRSGVASEANIIDGIETVLSLYHHNIKQGTEVIRNYEITPVILCYPDELNQVWTNLFVNALQAMEYKGTLTIGVYDAGDSIKITITDSGCGIPKEITEKIFEPFFTTKRQGEGTGLGLDIVKKIIVKHQGEITVDSVPGCTTFNILLPKKMLVNTTGE